MKQHNRTEEQQKDYIFQIFQECQKETVSVRRQVKYSMLCEQIFKWYRDYTRFDVADMGLEIAKVVYRFLTDKTITKIPNDKEGFFKYLQTSVKREKAAFHCDHNEKDIIKIPKEKKGKLKRVEEDLIRMKEHQHGKELTVDERDHVISEWFSKKQEYNDLWNLLNNNKNDKKNISKYPAAGSNDPLDQFMEKSDMEAILSAVKSLIEKKQERSRPCYRALFTLHCIERIGADKNFEILCPVLERDILEAWQKSNTRPKQYEIYQQYHPKAKKASAEAMASKDLAEFLADIKTYLNERKS